MLTDRRLVQVRHDDDMLDLGNARRDLANTIETVDLAARVQIALGAEQDARLDLPEPVKHAAAPKSGEHDDQMAPIDVRANMAITVSGMFRHEPGYTIAGLHTHASQRRRHARNFAAQLVKGEAPQRPALVPRHDRFAIVRRSAEGSRRSSRSCRRTSSAPAADPAARRAFGR
jgi:hypothetical protein